VTAKVLPFPTFAATRDTVAGISSAMQVLAHFRKGPRRPVDERPPLALVPMEAAPNVHPKCACGEPSCQAGPLYDDYLRLRESWQKDPGQPYAPVALAYLAYEVVADDCFARICPHLRRREHGLVTVSGVDLDSGDIGDIRYLVRQTADGHDVRPLPGQPITEADAEHYRDAAIGQWELERSL